MYDTLVFTDPLKKACVSKKWLGDHKVGVVLFSKNLTLRLICSVIQLSKRGDVMLRDLCCVFSNALIEMNLLGTQCYSKKTHMELSENREREKHLLYHG